MRVPDNLDIFEMHEREEARQERMRQKRINRMTTYELEEELGFKTVEEANKEREEK